MTHDPLDQHLDALGGELDRGVARVERRRRRRLGVAGSATVLAAIGLGALVALPGGRELDPVAQARAAVSGSGGGILHYVVRMEFIPPSGTSMHAPRDPGLTEVWTTTDGAGRYRVREPMDGRPRYCGTMLFAGPTPGKGRKRLEGPGLTAPTEFAQDGRTRTIYSPFSRAAVVQELTPEQARESLDPRGYGLTPGFGEVDRRDPVHVIQSALRSGQLSDGGTTTIDGRPVRRLVGTAGPTVAQARSLAAGDADDRNRWRKAQQRSGKQLSPTRYTYLVDADTAIPVELRTDYYSIWSRAGGRNHWKWTGQLTRFTTFERLGASPATLGQLVIPMRAGTRIYRMGGAASSGPVPFKQMLRDERAAVRRCEAAMR